MHPIWHPIWAFILLTKIRFVVTENRVISYQFLGYFWRIEKGHNKVIIHLLLQIINGLRYVSHAICYQWSEYTVYIYMIQISLIYEDFPLFRQNWFMKFTFEIYIFISNLTWDDSNTGKKNCLNYNFADVFFILLSLCSSPSLTKTTSYLPAAVLRRLTFIASINTKNARYPVCGHEPCLREQ